MVPNMVARGDGVIANSLSPLPSDILRSSVQDPARGSGREPGRRRGSLLRHDQEPRLSARAFVLRVLFGLFGLDDSTALVTASLQGSQKVRCTARPVTPCLERIDVLCLARCGLASCASRPRSTPDVFRDGKRVEEACAGRTAAGPGTTYVQRFWLRDPSSHAVGKFQVGFSRSGRVVPRAHDAKSWPYSSPFGRLPLGQSGCEELQRDI
ncbi:hypothetical protein LZ30DRAFT_211961 [Colletotrichum cereale]|nr:hypothetical protein LZ30DRAFT_211961 [Colletotrichum cereale]